MPTTLQKAYNAYCDVVRKKFPPAAQDRISTDSIHLIQSRVEECEATPEFATLCKETVRTKLSYESKDINFTLSRYKSCIQHFLRRSNFYSNVFHEKKTDFDWQRYNSAFSQEKEIITHLAPLEGLDFHEDEYNFEDFKIRRLTKEELDCLLEQETAQLFFPNAKTDTDLLSYYWWLIVAEEKNIPRRDFFDFDFSDYDKVRHKTTDFSEIINRALLRLTLVNWKKDDLCDEIPLQIPFIISVSNDLLNPLPIAPDLLKLFMEPLCDQRTGEEIGERPFHLCWINKQKSEDFKAQVQRYHAMLKNLEAPPKRWNFLNVATTFFLKASFSSGMEQLLWNIVVIEALVGEKGDGLTEKIAKRVATILGTTKEEKDLFRKTFKKLYSFRSNMVHGNTIDDKVMLQHLLEARQLARGLLVWWLHYLAGVKSAISDMEKLPERKILLSLLDTNATDRSHLEKLCAQLPNDFPKVQEWRESTINTGESQ